MESRGAPASLMGMETWIMGMEDSWWSPVFLGIVKRRKVSQGSAT